MENIDVKIVEQVMKVYIEIFLQANEELLELEEDLRLN